MKSRQAELTGLKAELAAIPTPDVSKVQSQNALAAEKQTRVTALNTALSHRVAWDRVFRELSLVLPDDVWLTTVSAKAPVSSSAAVAAPAPGDGRRDRAHARRLHVLACGRRPPAQPARRDPGHRQRPAPAEPAVQGRQRAGRALHDRRRRPQPGGGLVKRQLPQSVVIALIVVGFVLAAAGGYFMLIGPQRSKASDLDKQIADTNAAIDSARALTLQAKQGAQIRIADVFRLTKAMPDQTDMAGIVLELNQVAQASGITFEQITPSATATPLSGYVAIPITVEFQGNFYELADFLYRLRNLVDVRHGALDATGRLFAIDTDLLCRGASAARLPADPGPAHDRRVRVRDRERSHGRGAHDGRDRSHGCRRRRRRPRRPHRRHRRPARARRPAGS